jgi:hypothetical protein
MRICVLVYFLAICPEGDFIVTRNGKITYGVGGHEGISIFDAKIIFSLQPEMRLGG